MRYQGHEHDKVGHLRAFHTYLDRDSWVMHGCGEGDEMKLLMDFTNVLEEFKQLPAADQAIIRDITARMGSGMADFATRDLGEGTTDSDQYDLYCHYVAGLVGEGLIRLFAATGLEDPSVAKEEALANHMGLFLQKTNIIRDYLEDYVEGRSFWPADVWSQYAPKGRQLGSLASASNKERALGCLNHLVADAMTHAPYCLQFMTLLKNPDVFRFCAIPQLMAIATLRKLANNPDVFTGVVKIRKGQAVKLMQQAGGSMEDVYQIFLDNSRAISNAIPAHHTEARRIMDTAIAHIEPTCLQGMPAPSLWQSPFASTRMVFAVFIVFALLLKVRHHPPHGPPPPLPPPLQRTP